VLKNLARDWSEEGAAERAQSYGRITTELRRLFADRTAADGAAQPPPHVLVPGSGLGRLCLEITNLVGSVALPPQHVHACMRA
jgi:carnosine N-methyltransferase